MVVMGHQSRDVLHIDDLLRLINIQIKNFNKIYNKKFCVGGSTKSYTSLKRINYYMRKNNWK